MSNKVHPVPSCAALLFPSSLMVIREYCLSFRHLIQADLVRVDRLGNGVVIPLALKVVIPEVSDRESRALSSGSSTKPPRR
ncbi:MULTISPECIES: hypothetical protein [Colwellia]|uniref:hypothetical protein n=1 Tax=Colwellia TaxID=28228 RepID=UPI00117C88A1|nr:MULTISPECIES: hypothetical protein [Colwellia]